MMLNDQDIEEFKAAYKEAFGEEVAYAEANSKRRVHPQVVAAHPAMPDAGASE